MELRCQSHKLHGVLVETGFGIIEVACDNRLCGKEPGVVVRHRFDLSDGKLLETKRYQDPSKLFSQGKKKEESKCP